MIQRIQSLFLLLAAIAGGVMGSFDLWKATYVKGATAAVEIFNAASSYLIFTVLMLSTILSLVTIFLYKKRKLQFRLTVLNILLSIGILVLIYLGVQNTANKLVENGASNLRANYLLPAFLPVVMTVCLFLAARGIYKDEKLIKSLDRLR
ncbi:DUF4293 domain-containing protein [Chitinophaga sp. GCM10012297]|uniref:DUF4293 domain-containing protein n=1 Tax=Chitinophaga chungangae TaxID=2821488 RepID=A0ABS3YFI1_9BACT|nr:DUF4293 domain-containing protein [Chitinophaga chungangae]MBO9153436.1 DUF4293 domain-containing protein [Chitinophaga chungangae]